MICLRHHDLLNYPTDLWYITITLKRFNNKIIYWNIMHIVAYCIINCHLMHGDVYHEIPNGHFPDRLFLKACDSLLMTVCFVFNRNVNVKNWHCCLKQMPSLPLASAWGSIVNLMFCFLLKCCFLSIDFQKKLPSIKFKVCHPRCVCN